MELDLEKLEALETPTEDQFWAGFRTGVAASLAVVTVVAIVVT